MAKAGRSSRLAGGSSMGGRMPLGGFFRSRGVANALQVRRQEAAFAKAFVSHTQGRETARTHLEALDGRRSGQNGRYDQLATPASAERTPAREAAAHTAAVTAAAGPHPPASAERTPAREAPPPPAAVTAAAVPHTPASAERTPAREAAAHTAAVTAAA